MLVNSLVCSLDQAGPVEEEETEAIVKGLVPLDSRSVQQTSDASTRAQPDTVRLCSWHGYLFKGVFLPEQCGRLRKSGTKTVTSENSEHVYLHHGMVAPALARWTRIVGALSKQVTSTRHTFALAAFAQFHFVDVHPFLDGNGRICRFLSKYFLDSLCPLPFPMFKERRKYIQSLESARQDTAVNAPRALCRLLLDEAIAYYTEVLEEYGEWKPRKTFVASSKRKLKEQIESDPDLTREDKSFITTTWTNLGWEEIVEITFGQKRIVIFKDIDLESL
eukprot:TRINITY_DN3902_c0_g2_i1.p1 TRINITY_DN3902_c0_g2~~TRINITY_DN3902_c0_g2_i1.p1  ORF type:complete len:277 (-),score=49.40 TRINITY_DN3902_c0_g2_i1:230-1060(-)